MSIAVVAVGVLVWRLLESRSGKLGSLEFVSGPRAGEKIELAKNRIKIGALPDNDIVIPLKEVSRYHAEVRIRGGRAQIWDLQARNGTLVNGKGIKTSKLRPGDVIGIAGIEIRFDS